jgi:Uma2 family endonuclease
MTTTTPSLKLWTVEEYHRLSESGFLAADGHTELIVGQIISMAAKGTLHVTTLRRLAHTLDEQLGDRALIIMQDPLHLDKFSEPEPDLALVRGTIDDYSHSHPQPPDIYLIVEVADTTLKQDCEGKAQLYAQAGILDYWVVDVKNRQLHIFRSPASAGYTSHLILQEPHQFSPLAFPDIVINLGDILIPA